MRRSRVRPGRHIGRHNTAASTTDRIVFSEGQCAGWTVRHAISSPAIIRVRISFSQGPYQS
ncbi:MAG: hypothetical protein ACRD1Q_00930, partial [Vicinamibacterales bacterium]